MMKWRLVWLQDPPYDAGSFAKIVTRDASKEGGSAPACASNVRQVRHPQGPDGNIWNAMEQNALEWITADWSGMTTVSLSLWL